MKLPSLLLVAFLTVGITRAQTPANSSDAPGIVVTQTKWFKDTYIPALYEDPMRVNDEQDELMREQKSVARQNVARVQMGNNPEPLPVRKPSANSVPLGKETTYRYPAQIKNTGWKTIKSIEWEYVISDLETEVEMGRHRFLGSLTVRPGKTLLLVGVSGNPPTSIIQVAKAKDALPKYSERVVINRMEYDDGSFWQRPLN